MNKVSVQVGEETKGELILFSEKELDRRIEIVRKLHREHSARAWEIGRELLKLHDNRLWHLKLNPGGERKYKNWKSFVFHEFGMSKGYSYDLMKVARCFDSARAYTAMGGFAKAYKVTKVKEEERSTIIDLISSGAAEASIDRAVVEARRRSGCLNPKVSWGTRRSVEARKKRKTQNNPHWQNYLKIERALKAGDVSKAMRIARAGRTAIEGSA